MIGVLLLVAVFQYASANCDVGKSKECDESIYNCCDAAFQEAVGITAVCNAATSQDPDCVQQALDLAFYGYGSQGAFTVCNSFSSFRTCIDPAFQSCTKRRFWLENGRDPQTAAAVEALYSSLGYACGAGLESFLRNEQCLTDTYDKKFADLYKCSSDFLRNIRNDEVNGCRYAKDFSDCYDLAFRSCNGESAWWSCERVRTYAIGLVHHSCKVDCSNAIQN